ncbi:hypothetical protein DIU31_004805 [Mucilaginibacter rubeus]|uniref:Uncharacterized protein n=1 Tax=Mucilaginibacter rubeus TaxID=2027860 RepID=A0AAE6JCG5_9SPHI|nr:MULTISPECIES: hypothetical protein [Mucilaginibacter]QEM02866.1 hypothetical protein DIU31_004805 [Mucilaginibacter rubeus]QEM15485.1 hypothetical protein DIU38_004860 [Mucilaginibacter gossypii]QTE41783.1 hypothetical protein J3L19_22935 [Mucilaginibacter rubeus]QTE48387.1 hypothetical protein J3L21_22920 [Mucilaginibacter rubeus]QTE59774.1 hypothetical protein J3L23_14555 [Mucilaginibacter rubeus]
MYRIIEPEVAGGIGNETVMNTKVHPPIIDKLHYEFAGWSGDDILESFPCYIITERLKKEIEFRNLKGIGFDDVLISRSNEFEDFYPNTDLPKFYWAKINGAFENNDDFIVGDDFRLLISPKAFDTLTLFNLNHAFLEEIE